MQIEPIEAMTPEAWDVALLPFEERTVYHGSGWLRFLSETQHGEVLRFRITEDGRTAGYFAALLVTKGPFRILGSPLSGTMSEYMGPLGVSVHAPEFLDALDELTRRLHVHEVELGTRCLGRDALLQHGYEALPYMTFWIPLSRDEHVMWTGLRGKCRNRIRKGEANGLVGEECDEPSFVDEHYRELLDVFGRQGMAPQFPIESYRRLYEDLKPRDELLTIRVRRRSTGETIASGFFPHDGRRVYSLSTASIVKHRQLYPNELLHWTVMRTAAERGLAWYSIGDKYKEPESGGGFKAKFEGEYLSVCRYVKDRSVLARYGRRVYRWARLFRQSYPAQLRSPLGDRRTLAAVISHRSSSRGTSISSQPTSE